MRERGDRRRTNARANARRRDVCVASARRASGGARAAARGDAKAVGSHAVANGVPERQTFARGAHSSERARSSDRNVTNDRAGVRDARARRRRDRGAEDACGAETRLEHHR